MALSIAYTEYKPGECENNPNYMLKNCQKSCNTCHLSKAALTRAIDKAKEKLESKDLNLDETPYGVEQRVDGVDSGKTKAVLENVTKYMDEIVFKDPLYGKVKEECKLRNKLCAFWSASGECDAVRVQYSSICVVFSSPPSLKS
jgi:hypothetical protein